MEKQPIIELINVKKSFDGRVILKNVNLKIYHGDKIAIIGASGCGKSTLLRLILGLYKPDSGKIMFNGEDITLMKERQLQKMRLHYGMLFQSAALFDSMTVGANIGFSLIENLNEHPTKVEKKVKEILELVEMKGYEDHMPSQLSGGQKKRIGLARAIAASPDVLLYDEPTTGLDPVLSTNIEDLIVKLSDQFDTTSIVVSHQKSTILRTSDTIYMLHDKTVLDAETPQSIVKSKNEIINHFINGGLTN